MTEKLIQVTWRETVERIFCETMSINEDTEYDEDGVPRGFYQFQIGAIPDYSEIKEREVLEIQQYQLEEND